MVQKHRILYWDVIKAFAIFLVVWGHSMQFLTHDGFVWSSPINSFIVTFHMPLFMVVSGYFATSILKGDVKSTILSKFRQLLVPSVTTYFTVGIFLLILRRKEWLEGVVGILSYCVSSFWYLKALFLFYILSVLFVRLRKKNKYSVLFFFLLLFLPPFILDYVHAISTLPYFLIGLWIRHLGGLFWKYKKRVLLISVLIYSLFVFLFNIQNYNMYTNPFGWEIELFGRFVVRTIIGISGSLVALILIKAICDRNKGGLWEKQIAKVGTYTLGIYIFQYEMFRFGNMYLVGFYDSLNVFKDTIYERFFFDIGLCLPTSIVVLLISILIIKILRKNKYTRLIFLGEK